MGKLAAIQAVKDILALLSANWVAANTDNQTPKFVDAVNTAGLQKNLYDYVTVDIPPEIILPFGIHADDWRHDIILSIDCWTAYKVAGSTTLDHAQKMTDEVTRILKANVRLAGYAMAPLRGARPNPQYSRDVYDLIIDLYLVKINP